MEYTTQEEYLLVLADELKYLHPKDATKVLQYYQNKISTAIDYGEKESEVVRNLPDPKDVAKDAYESHGVKYLEIRKKQLKRKKVLKNIGDAILTLLIVISFIVVSYLLITSIIKMISLFGLLFSLDDLLDKIISIFFVLFYILLFIVIYLYIIDLYLILLSHVSLDLIKFKSDDKKRKVANFTLSGLIDDVTKKHNLLFKIGFGNFILAVIFLVLSCSLKTYAYRSLMDIPKNTETYEINALDKININANEAYITFIKYDEDIYKLEYQYEFKKKLDITNDSNEYTINIPENSSYDILDLLKEPTAILKIYVPSSIDNISITLYNGTIDLENIDVSNLNINITSKCTTSVVNSTIDDFTVDGYNASTGIVNCTINNFTYASTSGQLIIESNTDITNSIINNGKASVRVSDSMLCYLEMNNESGTVDFSNIEGTTFKFISRTSVNTISNATYKDMMLSMSYTGSLTISNIISNNIIANISDSYFITENVKAMNVEITASVGALFLNSISNDSGNLTFKSTNEGSSSKTEIDNCNFDEAEISQTKGYLLISNTIIDNGSLIGTSTNIIEIKDLDGTEVYLYLSKIGNYTDITTSSTPNVHLVLKRYDAISASSLKVDDAYNYEIDLDNGA